MKDKGSNYSTGKAFCQFTTDEETERCIQKLNGAVISNRLISCKRSVNQPQTVSSVSSSAFFTSNNLAKSNLEYPNKNFQNPAQNNVFPNYSSQPPFNPHLSNPAFQFSNPQSNNQMQYSQQQPQVTKKIYGF